MKKFLYFFLILSLLVLPASAQSTLNLPDTADTQNVVIKDTLNVTYHFPGTYEYYDFADYDTFVCSEDDTFTQINFNFRGVNGDFEFPITFWYDDDTSQNMTVSVDSTEINTNLFFTNTQTTVNITDDSDNIILSGTTYDFLFGERIILSMDPQTMTISDNSQGWFGQSVNSTIFPVRAMTFDATELNKNTVVFDCYLTYTDDDLLTEFEGFLGWMYGNIAKYDHSGMLYHTFLFLSSMWSFVSFGTSFFLTCTWSYLIIGQAFAMFFGVMQQRRGVMAMIEGYCKGTYWTLLLPVRFFQFLLMFFVKLVQAIGGLIPFT